MADFVKSATTTTPVAKTQSDIMAMLARYGASGFGFRQVGAVVSVTFHLPQSGAADRTVEIPINLATVEARLGDTSRRIVTKQEKSRRPTGNETHAQRVAWRVLYTWIDAALAAVTLGAQTIEEAFFAHLVVTTDDGSTGRMVDYISTLSAAYGGTLPTSHRLLLPSSSEARRE